MKNFFVLLKRKSTLGDEKNYVINATTSLSTFSSSTTVMVENIGHIFYRLFE